MASTSTRYTARFQLRELVERGRDELVKCEVYRDDAIAAVVQAGSTLTVRDGGGAVIVNAAPITVVGGAATYTILAATTAALQFGQGWTFDWDLVMPDGVRHKFRNSGALVRGRLYPCITGLDIARRLRSLDVSLPATITTRTTFTDVIDEADVEVQNRLLEMGKRPELIVEPTSLRATWLALSIALVFEGLASQNREFLPIAEDWRRRYEAALSQASTLFDFDEDGAITVPEEREPLKHGVVWTC